MCSLLLVCDVDRFSWTIEVQPQPVNDLLFEVCQRVVVDIGLLDKPAMIQNVHRPSVIIATSIRPQMARCEKGTWCHCWILFESVADDPDGD